MVCAVKQEVSLGFAPRASCAQSRSAAGAGQLAQPGSPTLAKAAQPTHGWRQRPCCEPSRCEAQAAWLCTLSQVPQAAVAICRRHASGQQSTNHVLQRQAPPWLQLATMPNIPQANWRPSSALCPARHFRERSPPQRPPGRPPRVMPLPTPAAAPAAGHHCPVHTPGHRLISVSLQQRALPPACPASSSVWGCLITCRCEDLLAATRKLVLAPPTSYSGVCKLASLKHSFQTCDQPSSSSSST